jgi:predicted signal transduction protein with EAL and GGDEF domain
VRQFEKTPLASVVSGLAQEVEAEGIASAEQLVCLRKLGCECGQGFYFSAPVCADACRNILRQLRGAREARSCVCSIIRAEVVSGPIGRQRR